MATVMKWLVALLACALPCMGQLTLQNAHYPTIFKSGSGIEQPPVGGFTIWLAPESDIYTDRVGVTNAPENVGVNLWKDLSGNNNHVYFTNSGNAQAGPFYRSSYTLNSKRIMVFGSACAYLVANQNRTGMITSNNVPLNSGFTMFTVSSFLNPECGAAEIFGAAFGYGGVNLLFRRNNATDAYTTFHSASSAITTDPATMGVSNYQFMTWMFSDVLNTNILYRSNNIVNSVSDTGSTPSSAQVAIGYRSDDGINGHFCGGIAEFILYPTNLTSIQVSNVNVYLKNKYGL